MMSTLNADWQTFQVLKDSKILFPRLSSSTSHHCLFFWKVRDGESEEEEEEEEASVLPFAHNIVFFAAFDLT